MWSLGTWLGVGIGSVRLMIGPDGLSNPNGSVIPYPFPLTPPASFLLVTMLVKPLLS